ncbi:hypothetical protein J437_LFUL010793 [Ladona fulva]|uniref:Uncharacterized protein n=1 Tax=Ladona fulva TaxID=123851 RepID=A0A8K0K928_LADFU|nr:hypothetical protein J437_LFUL010793 [Ladona fulva]
MPSSGKKTIKKKRSDRSLPPSKRHRPNPGNITQRIGHSLKWFLRSRKNMTEEDNGPSTSSDKETLIKKIVKRNTTEGVSNVDSKSKRSRNNKEVNELDKTRIPISKVKEEKKSVDIIKSERKKEKILDLGDNRKRTAKQKSSTSTTDVIQNETTCIDDKNNEQSEEGASEVKKTMEKNTPMHEEEDNKLELDKGIKENEKPSEEEIEDEKGENDSKTGIPSIAQESSSKEDCADDTLGFDSSITSLSVSEKTEIPLQRENKPKENIIQRNPCLGSCDEAEQYHWQVGKALRMENEDQHCKSSGGVLAGVRLSEHAAPPLSSLQEEEEWTEDHLMALLGNPQYAQPPFPITLNEMDFMELEALLDHYEENN